MTETEMQREASCMDDFDPGSLSPDEARMRILDTIATVTTSEKIAIRSALGRILAEDMLSSINVPSGTNSAMDGYAVIGADLPATGTKTLKVVGTVFAGTPLKEKLTPGSCARIMTGGILPPGTDTVVIQEQVERHGDVIKVGPETRRGANVREAGEDIAIGDVILTKGARLTPADLGLIASLGTGEVKVILRPRVAFFSTGDELRSIGENLQDGEVYDSNRYTLHGMLTRLGVEIIDMGVVRDTPQAVEQAFKQASECADVVITSGGVSVGEADYIKAVLDRLGEVNFWKVAIKPGRPLAFGQLNNAYFFGLPGNPVSVMVTFYQFVQPALRQLMGEREFEPLTIKVTCTSKLKKRPGRVEYQRGVLKRDEKGELVVSKTGAQGSGILSSMSHANCFIILPMESSGVAPGTMVDVQPFYGMV